jgi:mannose-6-phosphate isomerase
VECDKFVLERSTLDTPQWIGGDERFHFLAMIEGEIEIKSSSGQASLRFGQTLLIPASVGACQVIPQGRAMLLDIYLP